MELCQSFASASVMYAKMPRSDASFLDEFRVRGNG